MDRDITIDKDNTIGIAVCTVIICIFIIMCWADIVVRIDKFEKAIKKARPQVYEYHYYEQSQPKLGGVDK